MAMWFTIQEQTVFLSIIAKPNAKRSALLKVDHTALKIALHAKPHEGEANKELIHYLAELLDIPKSHIHLQRGKKSRIKTVSLPLTAATKAFIEKTQQDAV